MNVESLLSIKNLSKHYGEKVALQDASLDVKGGEIVALIGKNGAGKTTLLNSLCGIIFPDSGEIWYKGVDLQKDNSGLAEFGILITGSFFDYLNTFDNLALLMKASGETDKREISKRIDDVLRLVGLEGQKKKRVKSFSFGMKQRLGLAQTLLTKTSVLVLDEPFVGLDPLGKDILKKVILEKARTENVGVLFSSHDLNDVTEICDRVVMIESGKKVYDDVFNNDRRHCIVVDPNTDETFLQNMSEQFPAIIIKGLSIECKSELLNTVVAHLVLHNISITDMQTKENSLYDFFFKQEEQS